MGKGRGWARLCLMGLGLFVVLAPAWAQSVTPEDEYKQRIRVSQDIQPLGEHPFGANISLYNGNLSFLQTDVSETGTGPLLQLMRRFQITGVGANDDSGEAGTFGAWDLALPRIETLAPWLAWNNTSIGKVRGWAVGGTPYTSITREQDYAQRCTLFSPPPFTLISHIGQGDLRHLFVPSDWWNGYHLIIPGQGSQDLLANTGSDQDTYRAVTKNHWRFSCLSTVVNASTNPDTNGDGTVDYDDAPMPTGQGFLAQAPDGTQYWFDELVYRGASTVFVPLHLAPGASVIKPMSDIAGRVKPSLRKTFAMLMGWVSGSGVARAERQPSGTDTLPRLEAVLLVTKIKDRFGNTLTYSYNNGTGQLASIKASDGRKLTVQYMSGSNPVIQSVTLQSASGALRVWAYNYDGSWHLTSVTLPGGKAWHYDLAALDSVLIKSSLNGTCATLAADGQTQVSSTGTMTHPSGLIGTFTVKPIKHARWNVRAGCEGMLNNDPTTTGSYVDTPFQWYSPTIITKKFSGAGIGTDGTEAWSFSYQPATQTWANEYCGTGCTSVTTWTNVEQPDGSTVRRTFNNDYSSPFQSKLLRTDFYAGAVGSTLLRSVSNAYASPDTAPLSGVGIAMQTNINAWQLDCDMPLKQRTIRQWSEGEMTPAAVMAPVVRPALIEQPPAPTGGGGSTSGGDDSTSPPTSIPPVYAPFACPATTAGGGPLAAPRSGGTAYTWQAEAFDKYTHVTKTKRFNSIGGSTCSIAADSYNPDCIESAQTYLNDTTNWVLGLPLTHTNLTTGEVVSENAYDSPNVIDRLSSRKHFGQPVMSYTWDTSGQLASFSDALDHKTTLSNYMRGIPQTIGYPDGTSQSLVVDDLGQITSITNQAGDKTSYTYDGAGRLTKITYPGTWNPKTFAYAYVTGVERGLGANHWKRTVSQGNAHHITWYDTLLRPVLTDTYIDGDSNSHISAGTTYNWKGLTTHVSWPVSGSPVWRSSALDPGTTTTYDALGRVTAVSQHSEPDPVTGQVTVTTTKTAYLSGARKQVTDPAGHVTTASYQVFDTPSYKAVTQVQAPEGILQTIPRNLYGAPTAITQSDSGTSPITKHLYYDGQQRLCRTKEPETGNTLLGYDAAGNLTWSAEGQTVTGDGCGSEPSSRTTRTYDAMNRLTGITYAGGQRSVTTEYNAMGQVKTATSSATNGSSTWSYTYDNLGHLSDEVLAIPSQPDRPIHYTYSASGSLSTIKYPDAKVIAYAPDALGRASKAGAYAYDVGYFPDGALASFSYEGGQNIYLIDRNIRHLIKNLTVGSGGDGAALVYSQDFTYDTDANIVTMTDLTPNGERNETLTYDALNRLTKAEAPDLWGTETYTYDALNNIRTVANDGIGGTYTHTYHYDASNRLTAIMSGSTPLHQFTYDSLGDITQKDSQTRVFDVAHRLLQIPGVASYVYDAAGRRVQKTDVSSGAKTYYAYSRAGQLLYQWDATTSTSTDYVYLGKKLIAEVKRPPGAPVLNAPGVSIEGTPKDGDFTVSWDRTVGATYTLQQQINDGSWRPLSDNGTATSQTISGVAGDRYRYRVKTCDGDCSDWGVSVEVGVAPSLPTITIPSGVQSGPYVVSWNKPASATSFDVQQQVNGGSWSTVKSHLTATSISLPGDADGSYVYQVRAHNAYGTRGWATSGTVTVMLPPATAPTPSVPAVSGNGSYIVSWGAVSKATSYTLQEQVNGVGWSTVSSDSSLSKTFSGKTNGDTYGYRVKACNAGGCDVPWSATAAVEVVLPPSAPTSAYQSVGGSYKLISDYLRWDAVSAATYYQVKLDASTTIIYSGADTSYRIDSAIPPDIVPPHTAHLRACNEGGCSAWVTVYSAPPAVPTLAGPSNSTNGSYTLTWDPQQTASSYTLQEWIGSGPWHTVYSGTSVSKQLTGKSNGTYDYRVQACAMTECGASSTVFSVTVLLPPTAPAGVTAPATSSGSMAISWSPASTATSYTLQVQINGGSPSTVYSGTATSHAYTVLQSGQYVYRVHACNSSGCSGYTTSRTVAVTLPPSVPTLSVPTSNHTGSYTVSWSVIGTAGSYTLQQQVNGGGWSTSYSGSGTHKSYSGQTNGATYGYRVRACNAGGCGGWSTTKSVEVEIPPSAPTNVQITTTGSYKLINEYVKWDAVSGASRYEVKLGALDQPTVYSGTATSYLVGSARPPDIPPFVSTAYVRACNSHGCSAWATTP